MPVRLNIMIDDDLHQLLKRELSAKGISRFINDAIGVRWRLTQKVLDDACKAAARESWRKTEAREWNATDIERWPV